MSQIVSSKSNLSDTRPLCERWKCIKLRRDPKSSCTPKDLQRSGCLVICKRGCSDKPGLLARKVYILVTSWILRYHNAVIRTNAIWLYFLRLNAKTSSKSYTERF